MKLHRIYRLVACHKKTPLIAALWSAVAALVASASATLLAFSTGQFTPGAYWVVSSAVVTILFAHMAAHRGSAAADKAPALWPRIRALARR